MHGIVLAQLLVQSGTGRPRVCDARVLHLGLYRDCVAVFSSTLCHLVDANK
jgi:hypothetical protein